MDDFLQALDRLATGYGEGLFDGRRYGVTVSVSPDGRRRWLFGEELGGTDRVSCNVYRLADGGARLRPCEMPAEKVVRFVLGFRPIKGGDAPSTAPSPPSSGSR